jgi:hypothetical protein
MTGVRRCRAQLLVLCVACGCLAALAATASASPTGVLSDCKDHAQLTQHYSLGDLHEALSTMGADEKEYTDCYDVIQRALLADLGRVHPGTAATQQGGGSTFLTTPLIILIGIAGFAAGAVTYLGVRARRK